MRVFVISLPNANERRTFMKMQLEHLGLDYEFFDAIPGSEYFDDPRWYDDVSARRLEDRSLRPGEVGCALSHAAVYEEIVKRGLSWALILEDDAILHNDLPSILKVLENDKIEQGDVIFLERCDHYKWGSKQPLWKQFSIVDPILVRYGNNAQAAGYIVTAKAAAAMSKVNIPVRFPADNWGYYRRLVRFRGVVPTLTLIRQNTSLNSQTTEKGTRQAFHPYSIWTYLWYGFKVYTPIGRLLKHTVKKILGRE